MQWEKSLDLSEQYFQDELGRICPVHQMGWCREPWKDAATFQDAIAAIAISIHVREVFPAEAWTAIPLEEWRYMKAKRYLGIEEAFYLATGVDVSEPLFRFQWGADEFFNMRPDFGFRSLTTDLGEMPKNDVESAIRDGLIDYYRETEALKRAIDVAEIVPQKLYPIEWWQNFWAVRGIDIPGTIGSNGEAHLASDAPPLFDESKNDAVSSCLPRRAETTYLNIIAALLDCIAGKLPRVDKHPSFDSEAMLIDAIDEHFRGISGLSKSNLQRKFPAAKRSVIGR